MGGDGGDFVDIVLEGSSAGESSSSDGQALISSLRVSVDKRRVGGFTPKDVEGGSVPRPVPPAAPWRLAAKVLTLDVYVDHNIIEVYAMGGLARVTSRVYPEDDGSGWGLAAFGSTSGVGRSNITLDADVWSMDNAWTGLPRLC